MDDADRADKRITDTIADGVALARRALGNSLTAFGICHFCESPINTGRIFCSTECHKEWEHEKQRRKDLGLA